MTAPKLTPWFSAEVKPVRVGLYKTRAPGLELDSFQYWTGEYWGLQGKYHEYFPILPSAAKGKSQHQIVEWRGLAENPEVRP